MSDQTLLDQHIRDRGDTLITPFDDSRVRGSSYDVSAGRTIILALSEREGGYQYIDLEHKGQQVIPPGHTAILQSREFLTIPQNIKARISLKAGYATRMIFFAGGIIDPGFEGRLWLPIANLSTQELVLGYDDRMFRIEFTALGDDAQIISEPAPNKPTLPALPNEPVYDVADLSRRLLDLSDRFSGVEEQARSYEPTNEILQGLVYATLAGLVAGGLFAIASAADVPGSDRLLTLAVGLVGGALAAFSWSRWGRGVARIRLGRPRLRGRNRE